MVASDDMRAWPGCFRWRRGVKRKPLSAPVDATQNPLEKPRQGEVILSWTWIRGKKKGDRRTGTAKVGDQTTPKVKDGDGDWAGEL